MEPRRLRARGGHGPLDPRAALAQRLLWLIGIRVLVVASVVVPYALLQLYSRSSPASAQAGPPEPGAFASLTDADFLYLLAGLTSLATLIYIVLHRFARRQPEVQAYVQFGGDLVLITGLVYYFGGISSPFSMLYLVVIAVASSLLVRRAGITVATAAYTLYAALLLGLYFHWVPPLGLATEAAASIWRLGYNLAVHLFGFYAVAFLTSYLAENVSQAEQELEEQREDLADLRVVHRDVIESIPSGLVTIDLDGAITTMNRAGEEILRRPAATLIGRPVGESLILDVAEWPRHAAACDEGRRVHAERELSREDQQVHIGWSLSPLTNAEGHRNGYLLTFQDLTQFRALQQELRVKDRMAAVGELAAGIAHEIGNPLAAISGSAQLLSGSLAADAAQHKLLQILLKESQRLDRTIKGFLQFARPKQRSNVRFDVARLLAENMELLRHSAEVLPNHVLKLNLEPPAAPIVADPDQVSQIFWNLARNAVRAMPAGGELHISGQLCGPLYRLEVTDSGRGMSDEERAKIFQPFKSFFGGGIGVGMAIVYRIVQEHGGHIAAESRPGGGTRIVVDLPVVDPAAHSENVNVRVTA